MRFEQASRTSKWVICVSLLVLNVALWIPKADVLGRLLREKPTLLGRYSTGHTVLLLAAMLISAAVLIVVLGPAVTRRQRLFGVLAVVLALAGSLLAADVVLRFLPEEKHTQWREGVVVRKPSSTYTAVYKDVHAAHPCYPCLPAGYPPVSLTFRVDHRGFRNPTDMDAAGIVLIGDSFVEGYAVSDEQPWGRGFAEATGETVYNLGRNGVGAPQYWQVFNAFAMDLKPHTIMLMIFEGNDFRDDGTLTLPPPRTPSLRHRIRHLVRRSPLRERFEQAFIEVLGPINAPRTMPNPEVISWLPLAIPSGPNARYHFFEPKRPYHLSVSEAEFRTSPGWQTVALLVEKMGRVCREQGIRLLVLYAPAKAHVLLPLVLSDLPAEELARFVLLHGRGLPGGARNGQELVDLLAVTIEAQEKVIAGFCKAQGVEFISFTEALRQATMNGLQTYFTYDMHWTPDGHRVVAENLADYWRKHPRADTARP